MSTEVDLTDIERLPTAMEIALQIPEAIQHVVLPAKSLSIGSLLRLTIIPVFKPEDLMQIVLPPIRVVEALESVLLASFSAAPQSIIAAHLSDQPGIPEHLPLWAVTYWKAAHRAREFGSWQAADDFPRAFLIPAMPKASPTVPAASRAEWKPSAQAALVAALHKEKVEGRIVENGFKPVSWTYASAAVLEKARIGVNAKQCKNHWAMLCARYKDLVRMRQLSGFGWKEEACQLTATADVWDAYLQVCVELDVYSTTAHVSQAHPKHVWYRTHSFPLFDDLAFLCEDTYATGNHAIAVGGPPQSQPQSPDVPGFISQDRGELGSGNISESDGDDEEITGATQPTPSTPVQPKRSKTADEIAWRSSSFDRQHAVKSIAEALRPSQPEAPSTSVAGTPRRRRAWATVLSEETTLTPAQIASVRKIWRNKPELAEEYSSFPPEHREARTIWLHSELQELERN
ncbi:hypothetical protein BC835DRAFT_1472566 [Cytidiella melzeri]|nr:hypothetical protein BC835DRAFT_1472566 [Cytidiella melzeri]